MNPNFRLGDVVFVVARSDANANPETFLAKIFTLHPEVWVRTVDTKMWLGVDSTRRFWAARNPPARPWGLDCYTPPILQPIPPARAICNLPKFLVEELEDRDLNRPTLEPSPHGGGRNMRDQWIHPGSQRSHTDLDEWREPADLPWGIGLKNGMPPKPGDYVFGMIRRAADAPPIVTVLKVFTQDPEIWARTCEGGHEWVRIEDYRLLWMRREPPKRIWNFRGPIPVCLPFAPPIVWSAIDDFLRNELDLDDDPEQFAVIPDDKVWAVKRDFRVRRLPDIKLVAFEKWRMEMAEAQQEELPYPLQTRREWQHQDVGPTHRPPQQHQGPWNLEPPNWEPNTYTPSPPNPKAPRPNLPPPLWTEGSRGFPDQTNRTEVTPHWQTTEDAMTRGMQERTQRTVAVPQGTHGPQDEQVNPLIQAVQNFPLPTHAPNPQDPTTTVKPGERPHPLPAWSSGQNIWQCRPGDLVWTMYRNPEGQRPKTTVKSARIFTVNPWTLRVVKQPNEDIPTWIVHHDPELMRTMGRDPKEGTPSPWTQIKTMPVYRTISRGLYESMTQRMQKEVSDNEVEWRRGEESREPQHQTQQSSNQQKAQQREATPPTELPPTASTVLPTTPREASQRNERRKREMKTRQTPPKDKMKQRPTDRGQDTMETLSKPMKRESHCQPKRGRALRPSPRRTLIEKSGKPREQRSEISAPNIKNTCIPSSGALCPKPRCPITIR